MFKHCTTRQYDIVAVFFSFLPSTDRVIQIFTIEDNALINITSTYGAVENRPTLSFC